MRKLRKYQRFEKYIEKVLRSKCWSCIISLSAIWAVVSSFTHNWREEKQPRTLEAKSWGSFHLTFNQCRIHFVFVVDKQVNIVVDYWKAGMACSRAPIPDVSLREQMPKPPSNFIAFELVIIIDFNFNDFNFHKYLARTKWWDSEMLRMEVEDFGKERSKGNTSRTTRKTTP